MATTALGHIKLKLGGTVGNRRKLLVQSLLYDQPTADGSSPEGKRTIAKTRNGDGAGLYL